MSKKEPKNINIDIQTVAGFGMNGAGLTKKTLETVPKCTRTILKSFHGSV